MPYVTFLERHAKQEWEKLCQTQGRIAGRLEGRLEAIESVLQVRFPDSAAALTAQVEQVEDLDKLHELLEAAKASDLATIQAAVESALASPK